MGKRAPARGNVKTPKTRSKFRILEDPQESEHALKSTLRDMGLYAADTVGVSLYIKKHICGKSSLSSFFFSQQKDG